MAQDETLKLIAEVTDKFSPALRNLQTLLRSIHRDATAQATTQRQVVDGMTRSFSESARTLREGLSPALQSAGISTVALGAGLGGVAAAIGATALAVKNFAQGTVTLKLLQRETGISIQTLKELEIVASKIQIGSPEMRSGVQSFVTNMEQLRRSVGATSDFWNAQRQRGSNMGPFIDDLKKTKDNSEALQKVLKQVEGIKDPTQRRNLLKSFGLPEGLDNLQDFQRKLAEAHEQVLKLGPDAEDKAQKAADAFIDLQLAVKKLSDTIAVDLLPDFTAITSGLDGIVGKLGSIKAAQE